MWHHLNFIHYLHKINTLHPDLKGGQLAPAGAKTSSYLFLPPFLVCMEKINSKSQQAKGKGKI